MARAKKDKLTDEEKATQVEDLKAKRNAKKENLETVINFALENATDDTVISAANALKPQRVSTGITGAKTAVAEFFTEKGENEAIDETEIFGKFKLGRGEMRKIITNLIKQAEKPENRMWVSFDALNGTYMLESTGIDAPEHWKGYRPVNVENINLNN